MWKGRFKEDTLGKVQDYTCSLDYDARFYLEDIEGSKAHVSMLAKQGIISEEESKKILNALDKIKEEINRGVFEWRKDLEDVHMNIENRLIEILGDIGKKLHTARSRNDQVVLDFRMYISKRVSQWEKFLLVLIKELIDKAEGSIDIILPGFTHLQPAQPISLAHYLLSFVFMLRRDVERIEDAQKRIRISPLGAAAMAGTTHNIDPFFVAHKLGLERVFENSLDAVSDRDFVAEVLFVGSCIMMHLSRLCEDFIIWANPYFGFIKLPDGFATGSSIMPQKKNPDILELMRGKTGRVYGDLINILTILKALPLTYNRDLQEDKFPFMNCDDVICNSLEIMGDFIREVKFDKENMKRSLKVGFINATELADYLVNKGISFREAHFITGRIVAYAEDKGVSLEELDIEEMRRFSEFIDNDVYMWLDYKNAVARRRSFGGTGFDRIKEEIESAKQWLNKKNGGSV